MTAVVDDGSRQPLEQSHPAGVFVAEVSGRKLPLRYRLDVTYDESGTFPIDDPYPFPPMLGELDLPSSARAATRTCLAASGATRADLERVIELAMRAWPQ